MFRIVRFFKVPVRKLSSFVHSLIFKLSTLLHHKSKFVTFFPTLISLILLFPCSFQTCNVDNFAFFPVSRLDSFSLSYILNKDNSVKNSIPFKFVIFLLMLSSASLRSRLFTALHSLLLNLPSLLLSKLSATYVLKAASGKFVEFIATSVAAKTSACCNIPVTATPENKLPAPISPAAAIPNNLLLFFIVTILLST